MVVERQEAWQRNSISATASEFYGLCDLYVLVIIISLIRYFFFYDVSKQRQLEIHRTKKKKKIARIIQLKDNNIHDRNKNKNSRYLQRCGTQTMVLL